jgi:hypothetical protein
MQRVGWTLDAHDNDTYMVDSRRIEFVASITKCSACGYRLETPTDVNYHWKGGTKLDAACTYDNETVVSKRFKETCERAKLEGIEFVPLEDPNHFHIRVTQFVELDEEQSRVRFNGPRCGVCGRWEEVLVSAQLIAAVHRPLIGGFFRTRLGFGSKSNKAPVIVVSDDAREALRKGALRGLIFKPVQATLRESA